MFSKFSSIIGELVSDLIFVFSKRYQNSSRVFVPVNSMHNGKVQTFSVQRFSTLSHIAGTCEGLTVNLRTFSKSREMPPH